MVTGMLDTPRPMGPAVRLPQANVRRGDERFSDDEFVRHVNVPVFAEHETVAKHRQIAAE